MIKKFNDTEVSGYMVVRRFAFTEVTTTRYQGFFLYSSRPKTVLLSEEQIPYIIQRKTPITTVMLKLVNMSLKTTIYQ